MLPDKYDRRTSKLAVVIKHRVHTEDLREGRGGEHGDF